MSKQENKVRFIFSDSQMGKQFGGEQGLMLFGEQTIGKETSYWAIAPFLENQGLTWISNYKTERRSGIDGMPERENSHKSVMDYSEGEVTVQNDSDC